MSKTLELNGLDDLITELETIIHKQHREIKMEYGSADCDTYENSGCPPSLSCGKACIYQ